jgi:hypothetical protein
VILGVVSGGMFATSVLGQILISLGKIIRIILPLFIQGVESFDGSRLIFIFTGLTHCFFAPIFILASILGLAGIILLAVYLVNPYKRKKKLALETPLETTEAGTEESCEICEAEVPVRLDHEDESNKSDIEKISPSNQQPKLQKQSRRKFAKYAKHRPMAKVIHHGKYTHI